MVHQGLVDVSKYPDDTEVPWVRCQGSVREVRGACRHIDVRPNWKEQAAGPSLAGKQRSKLCHR